VHLPRSATIALAMATNQDRATRSESRSSSRHQPYGERSASSALLPSPMAEQLAASRASSVGPLDPGLPLLRDLLQSIIPDLHMAPGTIPPIDDQSLRDLSAGEVIIIPLLCKALEGLATMNSRLARLEQAAPSTKPPTEPTPSDSRSLAALEASVRDLTFRMTAGTNPTAAAPRPPPPPPAIPRQQANHSAPSQAPPPASQPPVSGFDWDLPRYDPKLKQWFGDLKAWAVKYPRSHEAEAFRDGKYDTSLFLPGTQDPDYKKQQPVPPPTTYASVAAQPGPRGGRPKKGKKPATAAQVAASGPAAPPSRGPAPLPLADRRFFAPRVSPSPFADPLSIAATAPDIAASVLRESGCTLPLTFQASVNDRGALTLLVKSLSTSATDYSAYYEALSNRFNQAFTVGDNPFRPFRPAPNEVQLAIHGLPVRFLKPDPQELCPSLLPSIFNAANVKIFSARYLQPDAAKRAAKNTTSVVITVAPADVNKIGNSILLFSRPRKVERAHSSNRFMQCRKCWKFGHPAPACKSDRNVCPLCANNHPRSAHRCPNPTCPKEGNTKAVPACCPASVLCCPNCSDPHTATDPSCPSKPAQDRAHQAPLPEELADEMETVEDQPLPPSSPAPQNPPNPTTPPTAPESEQETPRPSQTGTSFTLPPPRPLSLPSGSLFTSSIPPFTTPNVHPFPGPFPAPRPRHVAPLSRWADEPEQSSSPDHLL
jgi:hypothetical protein